MTYNIRHANPPSHGRNGAVDIDAIVKVIRNENPDLVALQEVDVNLARSGKVNQAEVIAEKLDMHVFFGRAIDYDGGQYGVAILSKYPLTETAVIPLPEEDNPEAEDRVLTKARITLPGGEVICFGSTHLDVLSADNRVQQVSMINAIAAKETVPFIVAGDFNAEPESYAIDELDKAFTRTCLRNCEASFPQDIPNKIIDFIAFKKELPYKVVLHKVIPERYASDHLPVVAVIRFK